MNRKGPLFCFPLLALFLSASMGAVAQAPEATGSSDSRIEIYSLVNYDFDGTEPGPTNRRILSEYVYGAITPGSRVTVVGYTDVVGAEDRNQQLSQQRAKVVADLIRANVGDIDVKLYNLGVGEKSPIFENRIPEGRFYNRTVVIVIEKPPVQKS